MAPAAPCSAIARTTSRSVNMPTAVLPSVRTTSLTTSALILLERINWAAMATVSFMRTVATRAVFLRRMSPTCIATSLGLADYASDVALKLVYIMPIVNSKICLVRSLGHKESGSNTDVLIASHYSTPARRVLQGAIRMSAFGTPEDRPPRMLRATGDQAPVRRSARADWPQVYGQRQRSRTKKRPSQGMSALVGRPWRVGQDACAFATTTLRHGLSTKIASSEARILAPAAMMKTLSQLPDDCCM